MTSYTNINGIRLMVTGADSGTWGDNTNANLQMLDAATKGVKTISLSGTSHTLTTIDGDLSDANYAVLVFAGSPSGTNTVTISPNDQTKLFFVQNNSGQSVVLTQGSGGNVTVTNGKSAIVYADGGGSVAQVVDLTANFGDFMQGTNNLSDLSNDATARTNLGVAIGTDVLAFDSNLQSFLDTFTLPTTDSTANYVLATDGAGTLSFISTGAGDGSVTSVDVSGGTTGLTTSGGPITGAGTITISGTLAIGSGGTGATTASGARTNLGLGTMATQAAASVSITGGSISGITDLAVADGGTGASTASGARTNLGLAIGTDVQAYDADLASWAAVSRSAGFDTFAATPSSANLRNLLSDETGTGAAVFGTSPVLSAPTISGPSLSGTTTYTGGASNWTVLLSGNKLVFRYGGTAMMVLHETGKLELKDDIVAFQNLSAYNA